MERILTEQKIDLIIAEWKKLRNSEGNADTKFFLEKLREFTDELPTVARALDFYDPTTWPDPWEIFYDNYFCTDSKTLLAYYTLALVGKAPAGLSLVTYGNERFLVLVCNDCIYTEKNGVESNHKMISDYLEIEFFDSSKIKKVR